MGPPPHNLRGMILIQDKRFCSLRPHTLSTLCWILAILFHFITSGIATWPLLRWMHVWGIGQDTLYFSWNLGWDWHALTTNPLKMFDANIYYPATNALATREHRLGLIIFWAIPWLLTHKQFFSDGAALFLTYVFSGVALHIWVRYWTKDHVSAGLAALWVNLNPLRIYNMWAIHIVGILWIPIALLALDRFLTEGKKRWWLLMVLAFWFQFQVSLYHAYGLAILMVGYFILSHWLRPIKSLKLAWAGAVSCGAALALSLAPFVIPYLKQTSMVGGTLKVLIKTSPRFPHDFFLVYANNWLWGQNLKVFLPTSPDYYPLWTGIGIPLMGVIGILACLRKGRGERYYKPAILLASLSILIFLFNLGPYLKLGSTATRIPLPFLLLMKFAPGLDKMSSSTRLIHTVLVIWAPLIGFGIIRALKALKGTSGENKLRYGISIALIFLALSLDIYCKPWSDPVIRLRDEPREVSSWLAEHEVDGGILELPYPTDQYLNHTLYMVQSLHHFHPIANGFGSYLPPIAYEVKIRVPDLPSLKTLREFAVLGIKTYVLHLDMTDFMRMVGSNEPVRKDMALTYYPGLEDYLGVDEETLRAFETSPYLREVARFTNDIVYEYGESLEVTDKLHGTIQRVIPAPPSNILIHLQFQGQGNKPWLNSVFPRVVEFSAFLHPIDSSRSKVGPWHFSYSFPAVILPEEPFKKVFSADFLPSPGAYRLEIFSSEEQVQIPSIILKFQSPVQD